MKYRVDVIALRKIMIENGYDTIVSLEKASGVSRNTISGILNETLRPSVSVIEKIAVALHMSSEACGSVFFARDLRTA